MKKVSVKRKPTTANTELQFDLREMGLSYITSNRYLTQNFTDGDIYVGSESGDKTKMNLIPSETAQVFSLIEGNILYILPDETSDKGVEAQCLI